MAHVPSGLLQRLVPLYALIALTALACLPGAAVLVDFWTSDHTRGYRHGFFILAITLWLIFRARYAIAAAPLRPMRLALVPLVASSIAGLVFWRAGFQDPYLLLMPMQAWLAVLAACGWPVARLVLFPIGFLYFTFPAWSSLISPLQLIAAHAVSFLANLGGLPTERTGVFLKIPAGTFEIGDGCSGLHYLLVGLSVAALLGELDGAGPRRRVVQLVIITALALFSNWIRILTIVVAGELTDMQHPLITEGHYWFGWCVFAVMLIGFLWFGAHPKPRAPESTLPDVITPQSVVPILLAAGALVGPVVLVHAADALRAQPVAIVSEGRAAPRGWSGPFPTTDPAWRPVYVGADHVRLNAYVDGAGRTLQQLEVTYLAQRQGVELMGYDNSLLGHEGLSSEWQGVIHRPEGRYTEVVAIDSAGRRSVIWYDVLVGERSFVQPALAQLWYGVRSLSGLPPRSELLAFRVSCIPSCDTARATLANFTTKETGQAH